MSPMPTTTRFADALLIATLLGVPSSASSQTPVQPVFEDEQQIVSDEPMTIPDDMFGRALVLVVVEVELDDTGAVKTANAVSGPKPVAIYAELNVKRWRFAPNAKRRAVVIYRFETTEASCLAGLGYGTSTYSRRGHVVTVVGCSKVSNP
jgi:hypothetical protein